MLEEGTIALHKDDRKSIDRYIGDMRKGLDGFIKNRGYIIGNDAYNVAQRISDNLASNKFPFKVVYRSGDDLGSYDKTRNELSITIGRLCTWELGHDEKYGTVYKCKKINYDLLREVFIHEFTHYVQDVYRIEKSGEYKLPSDWAEPGKYFKQGWEQQAHGIGHREKIQNVLKTKNPENILKFLKDKGLAATPALQQLKKTDYASWKAIMKQAVMNVLADVK